MQAAKNISIPEAVKFIQEHGLLSNWTSEQIALKIFDCINKASLTYTLDEKGNLTGIVFGDWQDNCSTFHVTCIVGEDKLSVFVNYLKSNFPQCQRLTAYRAGKFREYNLTHNF